MVLKLIIILLLLTNLNQSNTFKAKEYLVKYGYLKTTTPNNNTLLVSVKKFQKSHGLKPTGHLNEETMKIMSSPRCGKPDNAQIEVVYRWAANSLTYKIQNNTKSLKKSEIKKSFDRIIKKWTEDVDLKIRETQFKADIDIYFNKQDGPHEVLAYAYYPEWGDIYFDQDEDFTFDEKKQATKIYFDWVAAHELGHSLGLRHNSASERSIMYPYYSKEVKEPTMMDRNNLKEIYGGKPELDNELLCENSKADALLLLDGSNYEYILIKKKIFWRFKEGYVTKGPFLIDVVYPGIPDSIDAAVAVKDYVYFFKGHVFYRFKRNSKEYKVKLISKGFENVPSKNIDAAFFDPRSNNIYFFKGKLYYVFNIKRNVGERLTVNGRRISSDWKKVPDNIEAATLIGQGKVLFIKKSVCYVINLDFKELIQSEECGINFFKCV